MICKKKSIIKQISYSTDKHLPAFVLTSLLKSGVNFRKFNLQFLLIAPQMYITLKNGWVRKIAKNSLEKYVYSN